MDSENCPRPQRFALVTSLYSKVKPALIRHRYVGHANEIKTTRN